MSNTLGIQRNAIAQQSPAERESMLASIHPRNAATTPKTIGRREQTAVELLSIQDRELLTLG
jgi:hypothetical protein